MTRIRKGTRARRHLRADSTNDAGYTLVEIMVTLAVMGVVLALIFPVVSSVTLVTSSTASSSNANAEARNSLEQLTADIGSTNANNVCFPSSSQLAVSTTCPNGGSTYGNTLRALSDVYGTCQWLQWTVNPTSSMLTQTAWPTTWTAASPTPAPVNLAGPVANVNSVLDPVFSMATTPVSASSPLTTSLVNIQLYVKGSTGTAPSASTYSNTGTQYVFLQTSVSVLTSALAAGSC
jgi:prepilin-type N-terminal cleavage/methylation domain-containing protein